MRRIIKEEEPPTPSTRIRKAEGRRMKEETKTTTRTRRGWFSPFSSSIVHPSFFQELDWIVMKALEKERLRRYQTAVGFAADVQRYLAVSLRWRAPASQWYRLLKFMRRHRGQR